MNDKYTPIHLAVNTIKHLRSVNSIEFQPYPSGSDKVGVVKVSFNQPITLGYCNSIVKAMDRKSTTLIPNYRRNYDYEFQSTKVLM